MGLFDFAFKQREYSNSELPEIFPLRLRKEDFILSDIRTTYQKILTDVVERSHGVPEEIEPLFWDNCLQSEANAGLVSLLADAMTAKKDLFIVYVKSVGVLRKATSDEERQIREDYKKAGKSDKGVFVSFKSYKRTEMLEIYSAFEYCVLSSLNKTLNISKAVQIKINDLRASVSNSDANVATEQARSIARALTSGNDILIDKLDEISSANPDTSSTEKAIVFLDAKRAFILGLPLAYVSGEQTPGIGSTGEADARAVERGLKQFFVSIVRPVVKALFDVELEWRSQDFRQMTTALEVLKTFELTSDNYLSQDSKRDITARVFDVDPEAESEKLEAEEAEKPEPPAAPTPPVAPEVKAAPKPEAV